MKPLRGLLPIAALLLASPAFGDPTPEEAAAVAAKNIAEARKAQAEAELALLKMQLGMSFNSAYKGTFEAGEGAGKIETALLAADGVNKAAEAIAARTECAGRPVVLFSVVDTPTFGALISFRAGADVFGRAFADALAADQEAERAAPPIDRTVPPGGTRPAPAPMAPRGLGGATAGLAALDNLLGFFRTDYQLKGVDISFEEPTLLHATAGALRQARCAVRVPHHFNREAIESPGATLVGTLQEIEMRRVTAAEGERSWQERLKALEERIRKEEGKAGNEAVLQVLRRAAAAYKVAGDKWKAVVALHGGLFGKLATPDDKGVSPMVAIIKEAAVMDALRCTDGICPRLLLVRMQKAAGSTYTKKNLWTSLGAMPFYVAGGAVVSFIVFDEKGLVADAGVVPIHGGYRRIDAIEDQFKGPQPPTRR